MGKRKFGFKSPKNRGVDKLKNVVDYDDELNVGSRSSGAGRGGKTFGNEEDQLESILDDEIDKYNSQKEQEARAGGGKNKTKAENRGKKGKEFGSDDEEQEIYELDVSSEEEDEEDHHGNLLDSSEEDEEDEDDNDDDILGRQAELDSEGRIPDIRAWGKRARAYHNTDYVDQDFGGFEGDDAELAQQEEDEAQEIQKRLLAELDEADFMDFLPSSGAEPIALAADKGGKGGAGRKSKEFLTLDLNNLNDVEKRKLIERECPEVIHLLEEYKSKLELANTTRDLVKDDDISDSLDPTTKLMNDYLVTKYLCILNYCINISYFLHLRSTAPANAKGHPVIKTILQYRRLLDELNEFKPPSENSKTANVGNSAIPSKKLKTKIISKKRNIEDFATGEEYNLDKEEMGILSKLKQIASNTKSVRFADQLAPATKVGEELGNEDEQILEKRGITREMAKNKGLTPKRKKEQRNPRVKHREKFRKAVIRRKGQVRTARTEIKKYDGEAYGIKSHITKSIKLQ